VGADRYIYDQALIDKFSPTLFSPRSARGILDVHGKQMGRGAIQFFEIDGLLLVLRHYRRGGAMRHLIKDLYPGLRAASSRSFCEWQLLSALYQQGLPVPRPVAASFLPCGPFYRAGLITLQIENAHPLSTLLNEDIPPATWQQIGATLRRFHDARVFHADLNAHNILLAGQKVYLLDFDRGRLRSGQRWKMGNLKRLQRSLLKLTAGRGTRVPVLAGWQQLTKGYFSS
jgi:3-deoxy-D-manno-octulosonic acid kinase